MVSIGIGRVARALKPSPVTAAKATFAIVLTVLLANFFRISLEIDSEFSRSMDPGQPYIQAVAMHHVNGKPFIEYLSLALVEGSVEVDGVNIVNELEKFGEHFVLIDRDNNIIAEVGEGTGKTKILAVPPGGSLVMKYEWK